VLLQETRIFESDLLGVEIHRRFVWLF